VRLVRAVDSSVFGTRVLRIVAFKKDEGANWFVPTHQDRSIPIPSADLPSRFSHATRKGDGWQAEAPIEVLQAMRNVRLFIDSATANDGPLEVIPGSHRLGRIDQAKIPEVVAQSAWHPLVGDAGDVVVLSPLLLHRSARATQPGGRRVLQIECIATEVAKEFQLT
jgi:ectoine hydroxylase-related dioxygenase (phytanoyl-CoA dioxygenase family)